MTELGEGSDAGGNSVLGEVTSPVARLVLNRPGAINALDAGMVQAALGHLRAWVHDDRIAAVWIEGAGDRGLCAGGDVRALRASVLAGDVPSVLAFWEQEYALNALIASYPRPFVAWMDGVVMGGGVGVSAHGSHRLVTERTRLAMPETIIGFFPDVGGLWFLARAPGQLGTHVALTGLPVNGADAVLLGMADRVVPASSRGHLIADLGQAVGAGRAWAPAPEPPAVQPTLAGQQEWIDACYASDDVGTIMDALADRPEPAARQTAVLLGQRSPHSLVVTLAALRRARRLDVQGVLDQDRRLGPVFASHPDFAEGVRALLVDKDGSPRWADASVRDVDTSIALAALAGR